MLWSIILADVSLTINNDHFLRQEGACNRACAFQVLGKTIEAVKHRFGLGAAMYKLGASLTPEPFVKGSLHCCSGLAYQREGDFENSESQYLSALHEGVLVKDKEGNSKVRDDLNHEACDTTLENILHLYSTWRDKPWLCFLLTRAKQPGFHRALNLYW